MTRQGPSGGASGRPSESGGASYHGAAPADQGLRAAGAGGPGAVPAAGSPAAGKGPASEDEHWERPSDQSPVEW